MLLKFPKLLNLHLYYKIGSGKIIPDPKKII